MTRKATKRIDQRITLHPHQARAVFDRKHDLVVSIGGVGSGKTLTLALWMLDRSKWDTPQFHGLFAHTGKQLHVSILPEVYKWLERAGVAHTWGRRPPESWRRAWRARGIEVPTAPDSYRDILTLSTGLHVLTGTLFNRNFEQYKGASFGSAAVEEIGNGPSRMAVEFIIERVRCGSGREVCSAKHRHTKYLNGNPPEDDGHWLFEFLSNLEKTAGTIAGDDAEEAAEENPYPNLIRGRGSAILIPSSSRDNEMNLSVGYEENLAQFLDDDSAKRRLGGLLIRRRSGRVYHGFAHENEHTIQYDPTRKVYVALDFNIDPAIAILVHPLNPGEYPNEHARPDVEHLGVFGEFFHVGGMDAHQLATALVRGEKGSHGNFPLNWKGLGAHEGPIVAFGDATANWKSMTGTNSWQIVNEVFRQNCRDASNRTRYGVNLGTENPQIHLAIRSINAKLHSALGVRSLWIDPRCEQLILDFNTVVMNEDGRSIRKWGKRGGGKEWLRTHASDALRYLVHRLFPLGRDISRDIKDQLPQVHREPRWTPPRVAH